MRLLIQAERYHEAEAELTQVAADFPDQPAPKEMLPQLRQAAAGTVLKEILARKSAGQHRLAYAWLSKFPTEGVGGSVLDNTCLMFISNMWTGTGHDNRKVPVVTVGGLGGTLETGRSLNYIDAGDENRKLCSLYLGIMDRMGLQEKSFGDADTRLAAL